MIPMTKAELFVRSILGPARCDIRPLAAAIEVTAEFLQAHSLGTDDLLVTKDVYPPVARRLGKSIGAVSKCVERLSKLCWETLQLRGAVEHYLGAPLTSISSYREVLICLSFFWQYGCGYYAWVSRSSVATL